MLNATHHWRYYCCSPPRSGCSCPCSSWNTNHSKPGGWSGPSPPGSVTTWWSQRCCHRCLVNCWNLSPSLVAWSGPDVLDLAMTVAEYSPPRRQQTLFQTPPIHHNPAETAMLASQVSHSRYITYRQHTPIHIADHRQYTHHAPVCLYRSHSDLPEHGHYTDLPCQGVLIPVKNILTRTFGFLSRWKYRSSWKKIKNHQNQSMCNILYCLRLEIHADNC